MRADKQLREDEPPQRPLVPSVGASFNDDKDMEAGEIYQTEVGELVLVNGVARGGATLFFWAPKDMGGDDHLYYWGENPENPSDGMVLAEPWASAQRVGEAEPTPTGEMYPGELPEFGELMDYSAEEGVGEEGGEDDEDWYGESLPESRQIAAQKLVAKLLESTSQPPELQQHVDKLASLARQAGFNLTSVTVNPPDDLGFNSVDLAYSERGSAALRLFRQFKTMVARQYPDVRLEIYPPDSIMQADVLPDSWQDPGTPNQRLARRAQPATESVADIPLVKLNLKQLKAVVGSRVGLKGNESRADLMSAARLIGLTKVSSKTLARLSVGS